VNVFVIPSWYPHRCYPWEGVFLVEQARVVAEARPQWNLGLSLWGQGEGFVSAAHLLKSPGRLIGYSRRSVLVSLPRRMAEALEAFPEEKIIRSGIIGEQEKDCFIFLNV